MFFLQVVISVYASSISDELMVIISPSLFRFQLTNWGLLTSTYSGKHPGTSFNISFELFLTPVVCGAYLFRSAEFLLRFH